MIDYGSAKLLTPAHNFAVVQLPDRNYPGVVFQGDSLSSLERRLKKIADYIKDKLGGEDDKFFELIEICQELEDIKYGYEKVLHANNISVPYLPKNQ